LFAGHSERYSKKKNDAELCAMALMDDVIRYNEYGPMSCTPEIVAYYERPMGSNNSDRLVQLVRALSGIN
jgi:hypothetical protein